MQYIDSENEGFFSEKQTNETENFPSFFTFRYYNHLQAIFLDFFQGDKEWHGTLCLRTLSMLWPLCLPNCTILTWNCWNFGVFVSNARKLACVTGAKKGARGGMKKRVTLHARGNRNCDSLFPSTQAKRTEQLNKQQTKKRRSIEDKYPKLFSFDLFCNL